MYLAGIGWYMFTVVFTVVRCAVLLFTVNFSALVLYLHCFTFAVHFKLRPQILFYFVLTQVMLSVYE